MAVINEIAPDVFRICIHRPDIDLQFSQFLVRDDEPLIFHTLMNSMFPEAREAVSKLIDIRKLRWISFSHFEADECGSLNQWLGRTRLFHARRLGQRQRFLFAAATHAGGS